MALALLTVVAAQLLDLGSFLRMVGRDGVGSEANPLVAATFSGLGTPGVLLLKVLLLVVVVGIAAAGWLRRDQPSWRVAASLTLGVAIVAGLAGGFSNARVLLGA
jgi:hypothetical protein